MSSVVFVAGARPNFMKIAPILRAMEARGGPLRDVLVHTGQHYDAAMSDIFFEQLGIRQPDAFLQVGSGSHAAQTAKIMTTFEEYLLSRDQMPRGVVVVGDVNSTVACTLVAVKMRIRVAHVEAGLRSFDRAMPEEINRLVTDAISDLLLVSDPAGMENLAREGIPSEQVRYVGNVMIDTLVHQLEAARALDMPTTFDVPRGGYAIVTLHRPSNVDSDVRLAKLVEFLERLVHQRPAVFPVHPRTLQKLREFGLYGRLEALSGLRICEPMGYRELLGLMDGAQLVVSDSGGIQEETSYLGVPCVTLRPNTERPVTVTQGTNTVVGEDLDAAWRRVEEILASPRPAVRAIDGWDGHAAERVVDALIETWC